MTNKSVNGYQKKKRGDILFYSLMVALPLLQYFIFYIVVNFNSILLSFQQYEVDGYGYKYAFVGADLFKNYRTVILDLFYEQALLSAIKNSFVVYLCRLLIITPLALVFSYYLMRKLAGHHIFRVILFVPTIICSVILIYMYRILIDNIIPEILVNIFSGEKSDYQYLVNPDTRFTAILIYRIFIAFGVNVLLYTGAMSGVSEDMMEAARLDGVTDFGEFIYIIIPSVWPTLTIFLVTGVADFFINNLGLYDLYGNNAESSVWTLGYYMYKHTVAGEGRLELYPYLSTMGIVFTLIAFPVSSLVKWALEKFGPSAE